MCNWLSLSCVHFNWMEKSAVCPCRLVDRDGDSDEAASDLDSLRSQGYSDFQDIQVPNDTELAQFVAELEQEQEQGGAGIAHVVCVCALGGKGLCLCMCGDLCAHLWERCVPTRLLHALISSARAVVAWAPPTS